MGGIRRSTNRSTVRCRPIPVRGQVKVAIVLGLAHSLASFFSFNSPHLTNPHSFKERD
ncbi:hypothetical protein Hdeb2414_s0007g00242931 [Helianthus debilis subsp. tardiflorus]